MSLVLDLPAETEAQLRQAAARAGRGLEEWIIEAARAQAAQTAVVSVDEAAQMLSVARAFVVESMKTGDLSSESRAGKTMIAVDEKFAALRTQQAETQAGLMEIARINSALGLYD